MDITRVGTRPSTTPSPDYFTGAVRMDVIAAPPEPARHRALMVTFEPGARTNWHTHPYGQSLLIMQGLCLAQSDGGAVQELRPGDTVFFAPGERHWHGAAPEIGMIHLALGEARDGQTADWAEPVSDAEYNGPRA
ncbi:(R)-mandelonitrile lyase [Roseivivax sp. CAU 1753]